MYNYCCIGRYALLLLSLISRFEGGSPLLSFAMSPEEISGVARAAPLHIFYGAKFGFMYFSSTSSFLILMVYVFALKCR